MKLPVTGLAPVPCRLQLRFPDVRRFRATSLIGIIISFDVVYERIERTLVAVASRVLLRPETMKKVLRAPSVFLPVLLASVPLPRMTLRVFKVHRKDIAYTNDVVNSSHHKISQQIRTFAQVEVRRHEVEGSRTRVVLK